MENYFAFKWLVIFLFDKSSQGLVHKQVMLCWSAKRYTGQNGIPIGIWYFGNSERNSGLYGVNETRMSGSHKILAGVLVTLIFNFLSGCINEKLNINKSFLILLFDLFSYSIYMGLMNLHISILTPLEHDNRFRQGFFSWGLS